MRFSWRIGASIVLLAALGACGDGSAWLTGSSCGPYTAAANSAYKLPYAVGTSHVMGQGNCAAFTHRGASQYAYDFAMDIGTTVLAARGGTVIALAESNIDNNGGTEANYVLIRHSDGSVALYGHLTYGGVSVALGATVTQGEAIAISGNTGLSTGPHLHFEVQSAANSQKSVPVTFSNASPAEPFQLRSGVTYTAR